MHLLLTLALAASPADGPAVALGGDAFAVHDHPVRLPSAAPMAVNFEGAVCPGVAPGGRHEQGRWRLCAAPSAAKALHRLGAAAAVTENNHAADGADEGYRATRAALAAEGMEEITAARPWCPSAGLCVHAWHDAQGDPARALAEVAAAAAQGTRVVAMLHQSRAATPAQDRELMARFAAAGAAVVVAVGRHRVGPVEAVGGSLLFHGLGDLVFDCACSSGNEGLIVEVPATPRGALATARLVKTARGPGTALGEPLPVAQREQRLVDLAAASRELGTAAAVVDDALVILASPPP